MFRPENARFLRLRRKFPAIPPQLCCKVTAIRPRLLAGCRPTTEHNCVLSLLARLSESLLQECAKLDSLHLHLDRKRLDSVSAICTCSDGLTLLALLTAVPKHATLAHPKYVYFDTRSSSSDKRLILLGGLSRNWQYHSWQSHLGTAQG